MSFFYNECFQWFKISSYTFAKLLVYACQIEILENFFRLMLTSNVDLVLPLDALRRQMPSTVILVYIVDVRSVLT